ncbi:MAG: DNA polymerase [Sulfuriferula sp.]|nr:DNA polymerase [Sulfuriferula sp.]
MDRVTSTYEHALQAAYYDIGNRGIVVDPARVAQAKAIVQAEITRQLAIASTQWGCKVFIGAENNPVEEKDGTFSGAVNLNATQGKYRLLDKLKSLGYEIPKVSVKNDEGEYESKESTQELVLQKILLKNQFGYPGGDPSIKAILKVREYAKLRSAYLNALLYKQGDLSLWLSNYNVAGTLTGRRSCRCHTFGYGGNSQTFPKHSDIAHLARRCYVARPGNILLMVDQISAEDWPVSALAENHNALAELRSGTDRHTKLASNIFGIPLNAKTPEEWKESIERYLGKKTRHASNYDERANMMSESLIKEGHFIPVPQCQKLLDRMGELDPNIKRVFHKYVQDTISNTRMLKTPFGRERLFLGARPNDHNSTVFKEAYAYIPQSVVGDNTGFAVLALESQYPVAERTIVQEGHDSVVQDVRDDVETVYKYLLRTQAAFKRTIKFHNGIELEIPIEAEVGYDFNTTVKIKEFTRAGVKAAIEKLKEKVAKLAKEEGDMVRI